MSTRSVIVRLEAEVSRYVAGMGQAASATDNVAQRVANTRSNVTANSAAMEKVGGIFLKAGAVTVGALGAMSKASMDWETAWTGVKKTVDGTPEQLAAVEAGLRGLAKTLPTSHTEIAAVAEAAGQLGIQTGSVVAFTKTMVDLGESTNLSAEDAATGLARFSNVMGTSQDDVGKLGATLVGLGNNFATTESEILSMSMRLAGVGKQVGLSEGQVMGLGAAMSSVGIEAEAGGTAMSMVLKKISKAVDEGGEDVSEFARISGMSASEFSSAWKNDAGSALVSFTEGLGAAGEAGESVNSMLGDLGIKGIRETDTLLRLSAAGGLLGDGMTQGVKEYTAGTALLEEANKRYQTSASQVKIAWNKIKDAAIDAGAVLLPVITGVMESVSGLASAFGDLPEPVQGTVVIMAAVGAGILLVGGGLLTLIPKVAAARIAFQTLNTGGGRMLGTMKTLGKAVGIAGAALIAFEIFNAAAYKKRVISVEEITKAIIGVTDASKGVKSLDDLFNDFGSFAGKDIAEDLNGVGDAIERITHPKSGDGINRWADEAFGWTGFAKSETTQVDTRFKELGDTMGQMVSSGNAEAASTAFRSLAGEFERNGSTAADALSHMPGYENALIGLANEAGTASDKNTILAMAMGTIKDPAAAAASKTDLLKAAVDATGVSLEAVIEDMDKFLEGLFQLGLATMSSRDANVAFNESIRNVLPTMEEIINSGGAMGAMLNETGTDFDLTTEAGAKANGAFQDIARNGMAEVEAMAKEGLGQDALQGKLSGTYESLIVAADQLGITGTAADDLARKVLGVPDGVEISSWMDGQAKGMAEQTKVAVDAVDGSVATVTTKFVSLFEQKGTPYRDDMNAAGDIRNGPAADPRSWIPGFGKAGGGEIDGPGTGISDSVPIRASKGEHMFTAAEVDLMGGQQAVYKFRSDLKRNGGTSERLPVSSMMASSRQMASAGSSPMSGSSHPGQPIHEGPTFNVKYYSYNAVAEPESRVTENISSHLALIGGL